MNMTEIEEKIRNNLQQYIGKELDRAAINNIHKAIDQQMSNPEFHSYSDIKVVSLWNSWNWKKKLYWFWKHKISGGRKEIKQWENNLSIIRTVVADNLMWDKVVDSLTWNKNEIDNDRIDHAMYEIQKQTEKWWYEYNPKSIFLTTFNFSPPKPCDYVKLNFTIGAALDKKETI